jgi:hypothetical protein
MGERVRVRGNLISFPLPLPGRNAGKTPPPLPKTPFAPGNEASLIKKRGRRNHEFVRPGNFQNWLNFVAKKFVKFLCGVGGSKETKVLILFAIVLS